MATVALFLVLVGACATLATNAVSLRLDLTASNANMPKRPRAAGRRPSSAAGVAMPVHVGATHYVADFVLGDPPQRVQSVLDTTLDTSWTQCASCSQHPYGGCFHQDLPLYNYSLSRTAHFLGCNDPLCAAQSSEMKQCQGNCHIDHPLFLGGLHVDVFTFGSDELTLAFGCIALAPLDAADTFKGASGAVALGRGPLSLVTQIGGTRFSYCLAPSGGGGGDDDDDEDDDVVHSGPLFIGSTAGLTGNTPVTSVPLLESPKGGSFKHCYYLPMVGVTVGIVRLDIPASTFDIRQVAPQMWAGGVIIDTSNPYTLIADVAYMALRKEVSRQLGGRLVRSRIDELCVNLEEINWLPPLVLHFAGGQDLQLPAGNYWAAVGDYTACMMVASSADADDTLPKNETTFIGNTMQQNFHILYDLGNGIISFQPEDCISL